VDIFFDLGKEAAQGHAWDTFDGRWVARFDGIKEERAAGFDFERSCAVEGHVGEDVVLDFCVCERSEMKGGDVGVGLDVIGCGREDGEARDELCGFSLHGSELLAGGLEGVGFSEEGLLKEQALV